jgi:Arc/MetJ family transcription regulator
MPRRRQRPSEIHIDIGLEGDVIKEVRVGGKTAYVGDATVVLD